MKKNFVFAALLSLFVFAISVSAQKATDFSGTWTLDVSKSKLGDRNMIESQVLTVAQTAKDITITPTTKRMAPPAPPAGAPAGGGGGGGRMGGGMGGGDKASTYVLDGKEVTTEVDGPNGKMPVKTMAKIDGGKLFLSTSRTFSTPNGEMTSTSKETWSLSADGNTLTVDTESASPRGTNTTQKVFAKKT